MRVDIPGRVLLVDSVTTGQGVDITLLRNSTPFQSIPGRMPGFRMVEDFGGIILKSALDCEVGIFLAINDVQLGGTAGGAVLVPEGVNITNGLANSIPVTLTSSSNTTPIPVSLASIRVSNTAAQPIPVNFAGTVAPVLGVVTIDNTNDEAIPVLQKPGAVFEVRQTRPTTVINSAPVDVADAAGLLLVASASRRGARIRNVGPNTVAIGASGIVFDDAAVLINPGETWNEDEAPGAAWYAICQDGESARINIQEIN